MNRTDAYIRFFDISLSTLFLLMLSPVFLVLIIVLKFTGEGEIFFLQDRIGKDGRKFKLIKFATMLKDSPDMAMGTLTMKNDPRILPFGKVLRKTKINELPQFINVLLGDMSVIGPRPQTEQCFLSFPEDTQKRIIEVKPGVSGIASIVFRDEEEMLEGDTEEKKEFYDKIIAPYKGKIEEWYIDKRNLYVYFMLILLTICVIIFPKSKIYKKVLSGLPQPPPELRRWI